MFYSVNATEKVNTALKYASEVAKSYNNSEIATEHLLYGVIACDDDNLKPVFDAYNITKQNYEKILEENQSEKYAFEVESDLTDRAKNVFLIAQKLAEQLGHENVDLEHLLLSILLSQGSVAIDILEQIYKVDITQIRNNVLAVLKQKPSKAFEVKNLLPSELLEMGEDLTLKAESGKIDSIIGRDDEIDLMIAILCRKYKNNPLLIGEAGVGKSAIVEGLALRIVKNEVPDILKGKKIFSLNLGALLSGTKYRGALEEKLKKVIDIITTDRNIITFIDEIHTINQASGEKGAVSPADMLKPYLARGEMQTIGATTVDEYQKYFEKDPALVRRFQPITVNPPKEEDCIAILRGLKSSYENYHKVEITDEAIKSAVELSVRYITDRNLPDKALDLIDIACSNVKINKNYKIVEREDIASVVSSWTKIPVNKITETEKEKLINLEDILKQRVIGQEHAIKSVCNAIRVARVGLKDKNRPIGSFVFLGQTGVGKTELAKAVAEAMFDDEKNFIRIDMSEYMESHSVSKLIGSPPGFVGYEEGGQLTDKVRKCPYCVILFDEVEKAHKDISNLLLQILDDGRLTDGQGRLVGFQNTIIILTSNVGATQASNYKKECDENAQIFDIDNYSNIMIQELKKLYRPELINRIDTISVFMPLSVQELAKISNLMIQNVNKKLKDKRIEVKLTESALKYLIKNGYSYEYGARPLRRLIEKEIESVLADDLLKGNLSPNSLVIISTENEKLHFSYQLK